MDGAKSCDWKTMGTVLASFCPLARVAVEEGTSNVELYPSYQPVSISVVALS